MEELQELGYKGLKKKLGKALAGDRFSSNNPHSFDSGDSLLRLPSSTYKLSEKAVIAYKEFIFEKTENGSDKPAEYMAYIKVFCK